jgi:hypothetical protein
MPFPLVWHLEGLYHPGSNICYATAVNGVARDRQVLDAPGVFIISGSDIGISDIRHVVKALSMDG